jgi:hypothetical protein
MNDNSGLRRERAFLDDRQVWSELVPLRMSCSRQSLGDSAPMYAMRRRLFSTSDRTAQRDSTAHRNARSTTTAARPWREFQQRHHIDLAVEKVVVEDKESAPSCCLVQQILLD